MVCKKKKGWYPTCGLNTQSTYWTGSLFFVIENLVCCLLHHKRSHKRHDFPCNTLVLKSLRSWLVFKYVPWALAKKFYHWFDYERLDLNPLNQNTARSPHRTSGCNNGASRLTLGSRSIVLRCVSTCDLLVTSIILLSPPSAISECWLCWEG